jgi:hypothetical protein
MFKKVIAIATLLAASIAPASAEDLSYLNRTISFEDSNVVNDSPVIYSQSDKPGTPCEGGWSISCDPNLGVQVVNFFPVCDSPDGRDIRLDCLDSVEAEVNGRNVVGTRVLNQVNDWDRYGFSAKPELGIAKSMPFQIYRFEGLKHAKGELFQVKVLKDNFIKPGVIDPERHTFLIAPVFQEKQVFNCEYLKTPNGFCWITGSFDSNVKFTLKLRTAKSNFRWLSGRITDPSVVISKDPDGRNTYAFSGYSQSVPAISRNYFFTNETQRNEWTQVAKKMPGMSWDELTKEGNRYSMGSYYPSGAISEFEDIVSRVPSFNNADSIRNIWRLESTTYGLINKGECLTRNFIGLVSSNSMMYEKEVPTWDEGTSSLVYSVASPHEVLGKEFQGRYDLLISEQVAKCLWSLKNLTPTAEINVTSATGEKKVFTASSSIENGFYKFTAAGFTFSTNKISVKMLAEEKTPIAPEIVQPTPILGLPAIAIKKSTITCFKGKTQKKVTATKPKCPTGYKKK